MLERLGFGLCLLTILTCGCSNQSASTTRGSAGIDSESVDSDSSATTTLATLLLIDDFSGAYQLLSPGLRSRMTQKDLEEQWIRNTREIGPALRLVGSDIGSLPSTPQEYGIETDIPRSDWHAWEFATIQGESSIEIRALTIRKNGITLIEHLEFGLDD